MRNRLLLLTLIAAALFFVACGSSDQPKTAGGPEALPTATVRTSTQATPATHALPVTSGHDAPMTTGGPPPQQGGPSGVDTAALDKKIEQAEAKAKAAGASQADKQAAAAAYLERANIFYSAGNPSLYKFALRDFRRTLRYDPNNEVALARQQQIIEIYQSMGRPVPDLGNEP